MPPLISRLALAHCLSYSRDSSGQTLRRSSWIHGGMPCLHLEEKPQDFTNWLPLSSSSSPLTLVSHRSGYCQRTTSLIRHHCGPFHGEPPPKLTLTKQTTQLLQHILCLYINTYIYSPKHCFWPRFHFWKEFCPHCSALRNWRHWSHPFWPLSSTVGGSGVEPDPCCSRSPRVTPVNHKRHPQKPSL